MHKSLKYKQEDRNDTTPCQYPEDGLRVHLPGPFYGWPS